MSEGRVINMKPVSLAEVKNILKDRKGEKELSYEQDVTMKYVEKFGRLTDKQSEDTIKELSEINFLKGKDDLVYMIVAALPTKVEQLQLFLPKEVTASEDELKAVIELTKKFGEKI